MALSQRVAVTFLATTFALLAQDNQYRLTARPLGIDLNVPSPQVVPLKDLWFDYDNAVLQQNSVLPLVAATTGRCKSAEPATMTGPAGGGTAAVPPGETVSIDGGPTLRPCRPNETPVFPGKDDNLIFHVVNWDSTSGSGLTVAKQNWYIYNTDPNWDHTAFAGTRIFGKKQIYLYTIHLNRPANVRYEERYDVDEKHKTPAFLDHFVAAAQLFLPNPGGKGAETVPDAWYAFKLYVKYVPSDLQITPSMVPDAAPAARTPAAAPAAPAPATSPGGLLGPAPETVPTPSSAPTTPVASTPPAQPGVPAAAPSAASAGKTVTLDAKTIDNEGKYHIDFSVAVPIIEISDLSYTQTSNAIVPASVDKQKLFALFNYYPVAVDIKNTILPKYPYLLAGVAIGSQPLKKALFGIGWGPVFTNFYVGVLLNAQRVPSSWQCGDKTPGPLAAGATLENRTCPEFNFGLNVGVGAITDALKNKVSGTTGKK